MVSEGTIYPLLGRLQKQNLIEGYFVESSGGPPRKYYRIAETGTERLRTWHVEWQELAAGVERVLNGGYGGGSGIEQPDDEDDRVAADNGETT